MEKNDDAGRKCPADCLVVTRKYGGGFRVGKESLNLFIRFKIYKSNLNFGQSGG